MISTLLPHFMALVNPYSPFKFIIFKLFLYIICFYKVIFIVKLQRYVVTPIMMLREAIPCKCILKMTQHFPLCKTNDYHLTYTISLNIMASQCHCSSQRVNSTMVHQLMHRDTSRSLSLSYISTVAHHCISVCSILSAITSNCNYSVLTLI